jgi:hypothetical protein
LWLGEARRRYSTPLNADPLGGAQGIRQTPETLTMRLISAKRARVVAEFAAGAGGLLAFCAGMLLSWISPALPAAADFGAPLAGDYVLYRTSARNVGVSPLGGFGQQTPRIPKKVLELAHDDRYVIAKQQPNPTLSGHDPGPFSYWILDTSPPEVFGPLTIREFEALRLELGISSSLVMQDVYTYRPWQARPDLIGRLWAGIGLALCGVVVWSRL